MLLWLSCSLYSRISWLCSLLILSSMEGITRVMKAATPSTTPTRMWMTIWPPVLSR